LRKIADKIKKEKMDKDINRIENVMKQAENESRGHIKSLDKKKR
jgi:hypothetical protein